MVWPSTSINNFFDLSSKVPDFITTIIYSNILCYFNYGRIIILWGFWYKLFLFRFFYFSYLNFLLFFLGSFLAILTFFSGFVVVSFLATFVTIFLNRSAYFVFVPLIFWQTSFTLPYWPCSIMPNLWLILVSQGYNH